MVPVIFAFVAFASKYFLKQVFKILVEFYTVYLKLVTVTLTDF